ncbi:MAG: hypothetical protein AAFQ66_02045 [Pseudomonadota bacterium]
MNLKTYTLAALIALGHAVQPAEAEDIAGFDRFDVRAEHRSQLVAGSIWYPPGGRTYRSVIGENPVFVGTSVFVGAPVAEGQHPVVLFSHGSGGNMDGLGWLSSRLALAGAIVIAVNHPGSTSGDSSPRRSLHLTDRAADLSAALDTVLADPNLGPFIDQSRITAMGFSLGGSTALKLAGATFDRLVFRDYCLARQDTDVGCIFLAKGGVDLDHLPANWDVSTVDPRITSTIAIDPGFTHAIGAESAALLTMPTLVINLGEDRWEAVDVGPEGSDFVARLPKARYHITDTANHFTFLPVCKPAGEAILREEQDDPVCTDPEGTDRAAIHEEIAGQIRAFLDL